MGAPPLTMYVRRLFRTFSWMSTPSLRNHEVPFSLISESTLQSGALQIYSA